MELASNEHGGLQNRQINPATGYMENPGYDNPFDSEKKIKAVELFRQGHTLYSVSHELACHPETIKRHCKLDAKFGSEVTQALETFGSRLESRSRIYAYNNDKATIERIFHLKAIYPERYGDKKENSSGITLKIELTESVLNALNQRSERISKAIDAEIVESKAVDNQQG